MNPQEQMIHRRAVEAAVWGMPIEGTRGLLLAVRSDLGADWNDIIYFSKPMESRHRFLTANNQVPYVVASLNTKDGPLVLEVPAASDKAKFFGSLVDVWDYPFTDVGPAGADKDNGGKFLLLPPWIRRVGRSNRLGGANFFVTGVTHLLLQKAGLRLALTHC